MVPQHILWSKYGVDQFGLPTKDPKWGLRGFALPTTPTGGMFVGTQRQIAFNLRGLHKLQGVGL